MGGIDLSACVQEGVAYVLQRVHVGKGALSLGFAKEADALLCFVRV